MHYAKKSHSDQSLDKACVIVLDGQGLPTGIIAVALDESSCDTWFQAHDPGYSKYSHYPREVAP